jgi:hypothetical protein
MLLGGHHEPDPDQRDVEVFRSMSSMPAWAAWS